MKTTEDETTREEAGDSNITGYSRAQSNIVQDSRPLEGEGTRMQSRESRYDEKRHLKIQRSIRMPTL